MNKKLNGFRMPAEWELQKSVWIAWPYNKNDWPGLFQGIPEVFTKIISSISKDQKVNLLVNNDKNEIIKFLKLANSNLKNIRFYKIKTDRVWLRDSGPIFLINKKKREKLLLNFKFNAWSKYKNFNNDNKIPNRIAKILKIKQIKPTYNYKGRLKPIVMEGGAFDVNGDGSILLTEECLLSKVQQRNKNLKKKDYENIFSKYLNIKNFIWLKKGIIGDDTHGHVDDISRFVSRDTIMTAVEKNKKDKNYKNLKFNLNILKKSRNGKGKKYKIIEIPMPKPIFIDNSRVPASYLNFFICNKKVLLPIFNNNLDKKVIKIFENFFQNKKIVPINCKELIWGFGAIHCMTQQEPKL